MSINQELAGKNKFEMLVFSIGNRDFGLNVFKVKEIVNLQKVYDVPGKHKNVMGLISIRGDNMPVIDLGKVLGILPGKKLLNNTDIDNKVAESGEVNKGLFVITEYNRNVQALKIDSVSGIKNISWKDVKEPPSMGGQGTYLTSVVNIGDKMVQILDVEKILSEINGEDVIEINDASTSESGKGKKILVVDDSVVAQKQLGKTLDLLGFNIEYKKNGQEALDHLIELSKTSNIEDVYSAMITDIEMPVMDGYTLVAELRSRGFDKFKIIMHTSMSGIFNKAMVAKVGADDFIPKFDAKEIQIALLDLISDNRKAA